MEIKTGYKQTEVGVIPKDWEVKKLGDIFSISAAGDLIKESFSSYSIGEYRYPIYSNSLPGRGPYGFSRQYRYDENCITVTARGTIGVASARDHKFDAIGRVLVLKPNSRLNCFFVSEYLNHRVHFSIESTGVPQLTAPQISEYHIGFPEPNEQTAIANALSDADALINSLEKLIAKKRHIKQGVMQLLLTGKKRLPGFTGEWEEKKIGEIASPCAEKNNAAEVLPVLTCSKHLGFVDSLGYFKNQVFSKDTSTYKIIRRGQIGYPANHVEEGSIGLQDLYEVALVSPIYVVFSMSKGIDSFFLHRVLKLDSYRQKFKTATTSSVDRRGSLRWPAFSEITVSIPPLPEQAAIAQVLSDMDTEIEALERKLEKHKLIKQGMMQKLLTGKKRLI